jgi:hypothetical protein
VRHDEGLIELISPRLNEPEYCHLFPGLNDNQEAQVTEGGERVERKMLVVVVRSIYCSCMVYGASV